MLRVRVASVFRGFFPMSAALSGALVVLLVAGTAHAIPAVGICGDPSGDGEVAASDALLTLQVAVGSRSGTLSRCDCDASGDVTATDALSILQAAVGLAIVLGCPLEDTTTTTTSPTESSSTTTTTEPATCGNDVVEAGEDCEPPESFCRGGCNPFTGLCVDFQCNSECECPDPLCGDALIDPGEDCDPPGSECEGGGTCNGTCGCEPAP